MRIDLQRLKDMGFEVEERGGVIEIYPRQISDLRKRLEDVLDVVEIDRMYRFEVMESIGDYQVLSALRR